MNKHSCLNQFPISHIYCYVALQIISDFAWNKKQNKEGIDFGGPIEYIQGSLLWPLYVLGR